MRPHVVSAACGHILKKCHRMEKECGEIQPKFIEILKNIGLFGQFQELFCKFTGRYIWNIFGKSLSFGSTNFWCGKFEIFIFVNTNFFVFEPRRAVRLIASSKYLSFTSNNGRFIKNHRHLDQFWSIFKSGWMIWSVGPIINLLDRFNDWLNQRAYSRLFPLHKHLESAYKRW